MTFPPLRSTTRNTTKETEQSLWRGDVFHNLPPEIADHSFDKLSTSCGPGSFQFLDDLAMLLDDGLQIQPSLPKGADEDIGKLRGVG
jgi:hypothetical protein